MPVILSDAGAFGIFSDVACLGGQNERFWVVIVMVDTVEDGSGQFLDAAKNSAAEADFGHVSEDARC